MEALLNNRHQSLFHRRAARHLVETLRLQHQYIFVHLLSMFTQTPPITCEPHAHWIYKYCNAQTARDLELTGQGPDRECPLEVWDPESPSGTHPWTTLNISKRPPWHLEDVGFIQETGKWARLKKSWIGKGSWRLSQVLQPTCFWKWVDFPKSGGDPV